MNNTSHHIALDLQEVLTRNRVALGLVATFRNHPPTRSEIWWVESVLADIPELAEAVSRMRAEVSEARFALANLMAAAQATDAAYHEGELDPLSYLRDEMRDQRYRRRA